MDWSRYLADDTFEPTFTPTYGIFATEDEIEAMRAEHDRQVAETGESQFTRSAARYRDMKPERWIHRYFGKHDEVERTGVEGFDDTENVRSCNDLALAAVVLKDKKLLRLAVRHALSIAMCEYWCRDFTSNIPGGYREDRSFRRSGYCRTITRAMDLGGEMLTEAGLLYLLRRLTEEGIGKMDYVFWRFDYVHSCNQGPCFSAGRIPAYLVLERNWPRVKPYTELAFQDVLGFYDNALLPDGGYLEGPTYLNMTLHYALLSTDLYARGRGLKLKDLAPPVLLKTADYITCVSSTLPERDVIPVEDCGVKMGKSEMLTM
ncbi:MAG: hypothetical protein GY851_29245, partial [bacterium]|nr:hypothetical protein [bacterium]